MKLKKFLATILPPCTSRHDWEGGKPESSMFQDAQIGTFMSISPGGRMIPGCEQRAEKSAGMKPAENHKFAWGLFQPLKTTQNLVSPTLEKSSTYHARISPNRSQELKWAAKRFSREVPPFSPRCAI
jgi:hypothetical protein